MDQTTEPGNVDAVVVWRVLDGKIHEAWDIPAVNTVRPIPSAATEISGTERSAVS